MKRPGSLARRRAHGGLALVVASGLMAGCLVSFDGYQAQENGGTGDTAAVGASDATGGKTNAGGKNGSAGSKANGGQSNGGAGATEAMAGNGDEPSGGTDVGGNVNGGAASGGKGGAGAGGKAGNGGVSAGGSAGTGGNVSVGGKGGTSGSGGSGGAAPKDCPVNLAGPPMIEIPKVGGGFYCMDRTEVPNEDYAAFLATNPSTVFQGNECTWNDSFAPDTATCPPAAGAAYDPVMRPRVPVSCVDWCDAKRYCAWAGKRLCGAIAGGPISPANFADASADQWFRACSKAGTQKFPYGDAYQPNYCNGVDSPYSYPVAVANAPACQGGYQGLFDMSGNVAEWEDSCSAVAGANDTCLVRGGSLNDAETKAPSLLCNSSPIGSATPSPATKKRSTKDVMVGLRCCYDP